MSSCTSASFAPPVVLSRRLRYSSGSHVIPHRVKKPYTLVCANMSSMATRIAILVSPPHTNHGKFASRPPVRNAHIAILTDFRVNPLQAVRDRASDPVFASMLVASVFVGALFTRLSIFSRVAAKDKSTEPAVSTKPPAPVDMRTTPDSSFTNASAGQNSLSMPSPDESVVWLNLSIQTLWRLFRKSTAYVTRTVLQPVIDDLALPSIIRSIQISDLALGGSSISVRNVSRIPSRSLSEVQFRFKARLVADSAGLINLKIKLRIPGIPADIPIPLRVTDLDFDGGVWLAFTFVPYAPWVRFAEWALDGMPSVKFHIGLGKYIPVTSIPIVSDLIMQILTVEIPRQFLFPKAMLVDLIDDGIDAKASLAASLLDARGITPPSGITSDLDLSVAYPSLAKLFYLLDVDDDGKLDRDELLAGLIDWGFATEADRTPLRTLLDVNGDGLIQLDEFIGVWSTLNTSFVPRRFRGIINGVLLKAENLRLPFIGFSNPYVVCSIESQKTTSETNRRTSRTGKGKGSAVWNEGWELLVQQPITAYLRVTVREGSPFAFYRDYLSAPSLPARSSHSGSADDEKPETKDAVEEDTIIGYGTLAMSQISTGSKNIWVDLTTGGGRVNIDVQYNEYVDPRYDNDKQP